MHKIKIILFIIPFLFLSSCTMRQVSVNTILDSQLASKGFSNQKQFFIATKNNSLFAKEISQKIIRILQAKGYKTTQKRSQADYYLIFNVDMSEEKTVIDSPVLIPGQTKTIKGEVGGVPYYKKTSISDEIIYVQKEYNYFQKTLIITVYDNKQKNETRKLIWQGSSMSCCDNDDLRSDTDFLLISVFKYFGQDTKKRKSLTLSENNKDVAALRDDTKKLFRSKKRSRKKKTVV